MKRRRPSSPLLKFINIYHASVTFYLLLRLLFGTRWWWLGFLHTFAMWLFAPLIITVLIALFLRGKRSLAIALVLLLTGIARFSPLAPGIITQSNEAHDLRVLSFNVWNMNPQIETTLDWVLEQDADVLILLELVGEHRPQIPRLQEAYPYHQYAEGNVRLYSRYPFIENSVIVLEDASTYRDGRVAARVVIDVDGQPVTIYGVHLSVPRTRTSHTGFLTGIDSIDFVLRYDETYRNQQLMNLVKRVSTETNPVIIAGDFNTSHTSPVLQALRDTGMRDSFRILGHDWGMTWSHNPPALPLIRIDYIWLSQGLRPLRFHRGDFVGSDHLPLVVDFAIGVTGN